MASSLYSGVNIQYPISQKILDGSKSVETRTYPLPSVYIGVPLLFIETPGPQAKFSARIVGFITFGESFKYGSARDFYADINRHLVTRDSDWRWLASKGKWGWPILKLDRFDEPIAAPSKKGITFTRNIEL